MTSAFSPISATLILLAAGPLTIWSLVMFLMLLAGVVDIGLAGSYAGLLVFSFLGALACRRAINVLRSHRCSRFGRATMLVGIVAVSQVPVTMWTNQSAGDMFNGPVLLMLIGGLTVAIGGALMSLLHR